MQQQAKRTLCSLLIQVFDKVNVKSLKLKLKVSKSEILKGFFSFCQTERNFALKLQCKQRFTIFSPTIKRHNCHF